MVSQLPIDGMIDAFGAIFATYGYGAVAFTAFIENIAIVDLLIPGSTVIWIAGFYASQGVLDVFLVWIIATVFAVLANQIDYAIGHSGIYHLIRISGFQKEIEALKKQYVHRGHWFEAFLIYFATYPRLLLCVALGALRVQWRDYLIFTVVGAAVRKGFFVSLGYFLGTNRPLLTSILSNFWWTGIAAIIIWIFFRHWLVVRAKALLEIVSRS